MQKKNSMSRLGFKQGFGWAPIYLGVTLVTVAISYGVHELFERQYVKAESEAQRASLQYNLDKAALDLSLIFQRNADTIRAVSAFVAIEPDVENDTFSKFAEEIFEDHTDFKRVSTARNLVINNVHPLKGNELLVGNNLYGDPAILDNINRTIAADDVVFNGPDKLYNGDHGIVAMHPVYFDNAATGSSDFWGVVSLVIDFEEEIRITGLDRLPFNLSIRGKDARGKHGAIFWGDKTVFASDPVYSVVDLPIGSWLMAAVPDGGWEIHDANLTRIHWTISIIGALAVLILLAITRLTQLRMRAVAQMSSAINSIEDGFAYFNADDRLVACNDKYREFHGGSKKLYTRGTRFEDILRSGLARKHFPEAIGREEEWLQERLSSHRRKNSAVEQKLEDGRWVRISESRTPDGGTVGVQIDITELKNAKEEAERANMAKSEFLDVMSHELRTPLTVVLGGTPFLVKPELLPATQKVLKKVGELDDEGVIAKDVDTMLSSFKGLAGKVERSARNLLTLINEVLDYSKIEAGRMRLDRDMVQSEDIVDGILEEFRPKAVEKGLEIIANTDEVAIFADELRIRQVLVNLVSNAVKFTQEGTITVEARAFGDFARFRVIDTGIGIPADKVGNIFEKFSQANTTDKRRAGGTGLGLAISKKFVEMHGGSMNVTSTEGEGSEFSFTVPKHMVQRDRKKADLEAKPAA